MKEISSVTRAVNYDMEKDNQMKVAVLTALGKFLRGDWGKISAQDKKQNDLDQKARDGRILGKYSTNHGDIYITRIFDEPSVNADVVTVMYCEEY